MVLGALRGAGCWHPLWHAPLRADWRGCRNGFSAAAASAACRGLGFPLGGELAECAGCTLTAPLRVGWLACSANDSSLATCGYVALDPYIGGGGGTAELAPGWRASSAASCIRYSLALGRSPAVALSCRAEAHGRGLATGVIVGGALAATAAAMLAGWAGAHWGALAGSLCLGGFCACSSTAVSRTLTCLCCSPGLLLQRSVAPRLLPLTTRGHARGSLRRWQR